MAASGVIDALRDLLNELADGAGSAGGWILNREDPGLLRSLDKLSASAASAVPPAGGASIAAHVAHLRHGFELLNRWSRGEEPFDGADYGASWRRTAVSEAEWASLREALRREVYAWREALEGSRERTLSVPANAAASVVHLAYHLGAIRQIDRSIWGPATRPV